MLGTTRSTMSPGTKKVRLDQSQPSPRVGGAEPHQARGNSPKVEFHFAIEGQVGRSQLYILQ
jgi:hypothetical protein